MDILKNALSLLARSDFSKSFQFGLSERVLVFWCIPSNVYENPLSASQETNCVLINITRLLNLFNKQNCHLLGESYTLAQ